MGDAPQAIVLDIEGTVAPISFVYDVLFPYAKKHLTAYLEKRWDSPELQAELRQLQAEVSSCLVTCTVCSTYIHWS